MSGNNLTGKGLEPASIDYDKLSPQGITDLKASRLTAFRNPVYGFNAPAATNILTVTTQVLAASTSSTPVLNLAAKGIYVGSVVNQVDSKRVLIMKGGTNEPTPDSFNIAVYGILTESSGVYSLQLKNSDGSNYTYPIPTVIDFYFVEIYGEDNRSTDAMLISAGGSGGSPGVIPLKEIPTGVIDGVNDTFTLSYNPISDRHVLIFVDSLYVLSTQWTLTGLDQIVFSPGSIPQVAQNIEVVYTPTLGGGGGGGGTDLENIAVDPQPQVDGAQSIGTATKRWAGVFLEDQTTGDTWRLEVDNGVLQVVLVP